MIATVMPPARTGVTLFERCGGFATVRKVVMDFYDRVLDSEIVGHHFDNVDMRKLVDHQTKFISALMEGPGSVSDHRLGRVHASLNVTHEEFDEIGKLLDEALAAARISPPDRMQVLAAVEARRSVIVRGG